MRVRGSGPAASLIAGRAAANGKLIEARGGADDEIGGRINRILLYARIELALIARIAMDMVIKPGLG